MRSTEMPAGGSSFAGGDREQPQTKDRYVQSSLIEEAVTSSQLEGAVATREQAGAETPVGSAPDADRWTAASG